MLNTVFFGSCLDTPAYMKEHKHVHVQIWVDM